MNPIFPSILTTNYFNLEEKLNSFTQNEIEYIHLDVMDGHFVPNISFGPAIIQAIKSKYNFKIDSHLMVSNPEKIIPLFIQAKTDWISFHLETDTDIQKNIQMIHQHNCQAGLVLNPNTPLEKIFPHLKNIDFILLMSVFPGYGGQKFISSIIEKTYQLKKRIRNGGFGCLIQVDGGINDETIQPLVEAGADLFVIGTYLYNSQNIDYIFKKINTKIFGVEK